MTAGRRRGLLLLSVALASGGLAASQVHEHERRAAEELGPMVDVLVAARDLRAGSRVTPQAIAVRRVPAQFIPADALVSPAGAVGGRISVPLVEGSYLNAGLFDDGQARQTGAEARPGERVVTVKVVGWGLAAVAPGARVDVLVSTAMGPSGGRTVMALAGAELLRLGESLSAGYSDGDAAGGGVSEPTALATLKVSLRQAIYLTAADNFAREIRLLHRPPGDPSHAGGTIAQSQL